MTFRFPLGRSLYLALIFLFAASAFGYGQRTRVIVRSTGSREALKERVQALGGKVRHEFSNVTAVSADVPTSALSALASSPQFKVSKNRIVSLPKVRQTRGAVRRAITVMNAPNTAMSREFMVKRAQLSPSDYLFNNALINANPVQADGNFGDNVIVAVIDTGVANNPDVVSTLKDTVIGGESFVEDDPVKSPTSTKNAEHGTWVSTVIAGHGAFLVPNDECLARSLKLHSPDSIIDGGADFPGQSILPLIGVAPAAKIYALKVVDSTIGFASLDGILAAFDRVITLKKNFLAGKPQVPVSGTGTEDDPFVYDSLDIKVVNFSLGGPTLSAGRDLFSVVEQQFLALGITMATAAANAGPAGFTLGAAASGVGGLSVGATSDPIHERIVEDIFGNPDGCDLAFGNAFRPNNTLQMAFFSSRGGTADGRIGVDVAAPGDWNLVQSPNGEISFVRGTSFSSPTVAGAAALLWAGAPHAGAAKIRNALIKGANSHILGDDSNVFDHGGGFLDVAKSLALLKSHRVSGAFPHLTDYSSLVKDNLHALGLSTVRLRPGDPVNFRAHNLVPGEQQELLLEIDPRLGSVQIQVNSVTPKCMPEKQNQIFGDDVILAAHQSELTAAQGDDSVEGDYPVFEFVHAPGTFSINHPETGFMRVVLYGDWTNAGKVSADITITGAAKPEGRPAFKREGKLSEGEVRAYTFNVPDGATAAQFQLAWEHDWRHYPTNDIDLVLIDPAGNEIDDGATVSTPETVALDKPMSGIWTMYVIGFDIFGHLENDATERGPQTDFFTLTASLD